MRVAHNKGKPASPEARQKMREAKLRLIAAGWRPSNSGKKMNYSPEHLEKLRANAKKGQDTRRIPYAGRHMDRDYVMVKCPEHPSANNGGFVHEHRLIAEHAIGRRLKRNEVVHHINGDKADNRNSNLLICTNSYHHWLHNEMSRRYQAAMFGGK